MTYGPGTEPACFSVSGSAQEPFEVSGQELAQRIAAFDGPLTRARQSDGRLGYRSAVIARFSLDEKPLRRGRELLGFIERYGQPIRGTLELESYQLRFQPLRGDPWVMSLLDIAALQASSSSVQISYRSAPHHGNGVVSCRFRKESAYRWEDLLRTRLKEVWAEAGRGTIVDFQPRIRCG